MDADIVVFGGDPETCYQASAAGKSKPSACPEVLKNNTAWGSMCCILAPKSCIPMWLTTAFGWDPDLRNYSPRSSMPSI